MSLTAHYFRVGVFVLVGMGLILAAAILLGLRAVTRERHFTAETYFEESVEGLEVGSPVKLHGVPIGRVETITFVDQVYEVDTSGVFSRPVLVRMALLPEALPIASEKEFLARAPQVVAEGMRIRLASSGFTGVKYLEAERLDPNRFPPMKISWEPEFLYVPSAQGRFSAIVDSVDALTRKLGDIPFDRISQQVEQLVRTLDEGVTNANIAALSEKLARVLDNAGTVIGPEWLETRSKIDRILERMNTIANEVEVADGIRDFDRTMASLQKATEGLPRTIEKLRGAIDEAELLLGSEQEPLRSTLHDLRMMAQNMREFTDMLKQYPSNVLFGKQPPRSNPAGARGENNP